MAAIDWHMSAALENVSRGGQELPEVSSLATAVHAWLALDDEMQAEAILTPERPVTLDDGQPVAAFAGQAIRALADAMGGADDRP